jgi:histidine ammonia-lyase
MIQEDLLTIDQLHAFLKEGRKLELQASDLRRIQASRDFLQSYLESASEPVYGVNTGFGSLCNVEIPPDQLRELQENLLITHAAGTGAFMPYRIARLMLLLKIRALSRGYSAVSAELVERLVRLYNSGWVPCVHEQGSLGASGDLAPLAEMCLHLLGMGLLENGKGERIQARAWLDAAGFQPYAFHPKEALALINGTQFMLAYALHEVMEADVIRQTLPLIAGMSLQAFRCRTEPFMPHSHRIRPHAGQISAAQELYDVYTLGGTITREGLAVQDPYSFRCMPQVHGASYDALDYVKSVLRTELNAVTDNPNVFSEDGLVLSGGNFHGQPLALSLDFMAMALAELGSISERRTYLLISGQRGLPPFLAGNPGLDSGYMIAQYSAASMVSLNKQLCTPSSVDSIVSSNGQEDHVSMGANAATRCLRVLDNLKQVLAIEFACAARALQLREDRTLHPEIQTLLSRWQPADHTREPMEQIVGKAADLLWRSSGV